MKSLEELQHTHTQSLESAEKVCIDGIAVAKANYDRLVSYYETQKSNMISSAHKKLQEAIQKLEIRATEKAKKEEEKKEAKKLKATAPRIRRTKEEIETEQLKAELKRKNDESYRRHQEKKAKGEIPLTHADRENSSILKGIGELFSESEEEEEEEEEDKWDISDTTPTALREKIRAAIRKKEDVPQHILDALEQMEGLETSAKSSVASNPREEFEAATKNLTPPEPKLDTEPNPLTEPPINLGLCKPFSVLPQTSERLPDKMPPLITNTKVKKPVKEVTIR
jgi:hypothetical protein